MPLLPVSRHSLQAVFLVYGLVLIFLTAKIQSQSISNFNPTFQHLTMEDGLPSNNIHCLYKDSRGFLWIGTNAGAARYDGIQFITFRHSTSNANSLVNNFVKSIVEDKEGNIWMGTYQGLSCYHQKENRFENFLHTEDKNSLSENRVGEVVVDKYGVVWIHTYDGLNEFLPADRVFRRHYYEKFFDMPYMGRIAYDNDRLLWLNGKSGLFSFDVLDRKFKKYSHQADQEHYAGRLVTDFHFQPKNTLWVCTWGTGLRKFNTSTGQYEQTYKPSPNSPPSGNTNIILSIAFQPLPTLDTITWFGTAGSGLGILDQKSGRMEFLTHDISNPSSISSNEPGELLCDNEGILWVSNPSGLDRFDMNYRRIKRTDLDAAGLNIAGINFNTGVAIPERNEVWLSSHYRPGVFIYDEVNKILTHSLVSPRLTDWSNNIRSMFLDQQNQLWICTADGFYLFDPLANEFQRKDNHLYPYKSHDFVTIDEYTMGKYILSVNGIGSILYDQRMSKFDTLHTYVNTTGETPGAVYKSVVDHHQNAWMATRNGVFVENIINHTTFQLNTKAEPKHRISNDIVLTLCSDKTGVWMGTENGLNYYLHEKDTVYAYTTSDGLGHDIVNDIYVDEYDKVWVATQNGLSKFDPLTKSFSTYTMTDGLIANTIFSSITGNQDGRIVLGGAEGYNWFMSKDLEPSTKKPPIVITSMKVKGNPFFWEAHYDTDSTLRFTYKQTDFNFEFAALNFTNSARNQYAYRLLGYDEEWHQSGTERSATYTNLAPGDYIFEVKGTNHDGVWSDKMARIKFYIAPPFWKTLWFYALCIAMAIAAVFSFIRYRTASLRNQKVALENLVDQRTSELKVQKEFADLQRVRAEQSEKFKEQFLASMSHEIRTPMNAVMGMTNLLIEKDPLPHQFNYLDGIRKSSETLLHIINDILDLSKIESGKIEIEKTVFSLRETIEQAYQILSFKADEKHLLFTKEIDVDIPSYLIGDPVRLNQIIINLCGNAIKFTEKGSVHLSVKMEETDLAGNMCNIRFEVNDTGIGIPKEKLELIFDAFTQAQSSDTRKYGGTGLGLSISKQLVDLMGGKLQVESEPGIGSTFFFALKFEKSNSTSPVPSNNNVKVDGSILNGLRILLADDNAFNRLVTIDTLHSKADVIVDSVNTGVEVIQRLNEAEYDVILMDLQMPEMDGFEATRIIRSMKDNKAGIPIIALTASVVRSDLKKLQAAGMNDYVPKPFSTSVLISALARVTGRTNMDHAPEVTDPVIDNNQGYIDLSFLEKFCEGDNQRKLKYINMFLESVDESIQAVQKAAHQNDHISLSGQIHSFKTRLMMMGMHQAAELANKLEASYKADVPAIIDLKDIERLIYLIKTGSAKLQSELEAHDNNGS